MKALKGFLIAFGVLVWLSLLSTISTSLSTDNIGSFGEKASDFFSWSKDNGTSTTSYDKRETTTTERDRYEQLITEPAYDVTRYQTAPDELWDLEETFDEDIYEKIDERIPNFVETQIPDYKRICVEWESPVDGYERTLTVSIDRHAYEYYRALARYTDFSDYQNYIDDPYNRAILSDLADSFRRFGNMNGYTTEQLIREATGFVQAIPYVTDRDSVGREEFQKYPLEMLYDYEGDCEDSSFLLAGLLRELGCDVCLLHLPKHCAVGLRDNGLFSGVYYECQGSRYFYIEPTNPGWAIGDIPQAYSEAKATIYVID